MWNKLRYFSSIYKFVDISFGLLVGMFLVVFVVVLLITKPLSDQCWCKLEVWNLRNNLQWNSNQNSNIFIQENEENAFENVVCQIGGQLVLASICLETVLMATCSWPETLLVSSLYLAQSTRLLLTLYIAHDIVCSHFSSINLRWILLLVRLSCL